MKNLKDKVDLLIKTDEEIIEGIKLLKELVIKLQESLKHHKYSCTEKDYKNLKDIDLPSIPFKAVKPWENGICTKCGFACKFHDENGNLTRE